MSPLWRRRPPAEEETLVVEGAPETEEVVEEELPPPPPPPRIWPWLLALLLLVVAGGVAYWLLTREDEKTTMPRVIGLTEAEANARLTQAGLEVDVDRRPSDRKAGIVFAQTPGAGTQLAKDERVEIAVSSGLVQVPVPAVIGLPEKEAVQKVEDAGFKPRIERVFARARKGDVIEQDPRGGERAARGSTVSLKVSKGRNLKPVPDVVGLDEQEAVSRLSAEGFEPRIFDVPSPEPEGTVVAQTPQGGEQAPPDSRVRINVSTGASAGTTTERPPAAEVTVPNVVGLAQTPALRRLRSAGLRGVVVYASSTRPRGRVIVQSRPPGSQAPRGARVRITISSGTGEVEQVEVPDVVGTDEETARQMLEDAGFRAETIAVRADVDGVFDQQPAAGTRAPRGSVVTIFVGRTG